ncbi:adenosylcobalamin-dependent ribonucleoside-diphosphate reductase [Hyphomicrobium methylovorum]|uniref:adenosylcobalamin-dependent ribonucleoside-diphosphate reductase n=1 Tax=Hyphomicrobium methylovorum TaxID=84 RepID=UPI0015E6F270|nr:adenosylcobalamin-dependent ribonucleoside-diphosphate reductase [Hyphomicrobium methylovorum]MBA2125742.1 adenosylcobalamin-dependent ribonucleoside-diphosphate reductase [Hyphomicrobium methylovorum]
MPVSSLQLPAISDAIWRRKYRFAGSAERPADETVEDTFRRVAEAAAFAEKGGEREQQKWAEAFYEAMADFGFQPAGRILAGAGTDRNVTLFNCFVLGTIPDDLSGIFDSVKEAALTMQAGGGIGHDFSTLRPRGAAVKSIGADASGPVSFMDVWDAMCRTIMSAGQRRGAMMATLRCDHPDIEDFIAAKAQSDRLRNFNLSVLVTDLFMDAVRTGSSWDLVFEGKVYKTVDARALWDKIMRATYDYAEPGVIFIDRINALNNLSYCETIAATNPCGEQPLPPYGACLLGSINLARLVIDPFTPNARIDVAKLEARVATAVRFLDNVIDISRYPLTAQAEEARAKRRIGLGVTGLADALIFLGLPYGSPEARERAAEWMAIIQNGAYRTSAALAAEKGPFPLYDAQAFLDRPNIAKLDPDVRAAIAAHGIRNGCLTSIAPTGTISLLAGNVSSGIEPVFDFVFQRRVLGTDRTAQEETVEDFAHRLFRERLGEETPLTPAFVTAETLQPAEHVAMQAALQPYVDSAISKTVNCPEDISFERFRDIYVEAYDLGLKGCTTYRPNPVTGAVLSRAPAPSATESSAPAQSGVTPLAHSSPADASARSGDVVYMTKPLERDAALEGVTYKIKWPASAHALYVTINDIVRDGRRRPFEIFINTKNLEHYAWTVALTRMISAVFRRGGDVAFVAEELKAVFDPEGGRFMDGRYVPSLLAAIGDVIEQHLHHIGFLAGGEADSENLPDAQRRSASASPLISEAGGHPQNATVGAAGVHGPSLTGARACPQCGERSLRMIEGCWTCASCSYSRCG